MLSAPKVALAANGIDNLRRTQQGGGVLSAADARRHTYAVVRRPADGQPRNSRARLSDPTHAVDMADGVLRQAPTPARHTRRRRNAAETKAIAQLGGGELNELVVVALQLGDLAMSADRAAHDLTTARLEPPLRGRESDGLYGAPLDRRHEITRAGRHLRVSPRRRDNRHARVVDRRQFGSGTRHDVGKQPGRRCRGAPHADRVAGKRLLVRRRPVHDAPTVSRSLYPPNGPAEDYVCTTRPKDCVWQAPEPATQ